jgi:hypothetical protein
MADMDRIANYYTDSSREWASHQVVEGRREEYDRDFWRTLADANRRDNIDRALRVIDSGGRLDV